MTDKQLLINELCNAKLMLTEDQRKALNKDQEQFKKQFPNVVNSELHAMNRLIFFCFNYPTYNPSGLPKFIHEVNWTVSLPHMINKWKDIAYHFQHENPILRFYMELDTTNRKHMLDYIMTNYHTEEQL